AAALGRIRRGSQGAPRARQRCHRRHARGHGVRRISGSRAVYGHRADHSTPAAGAEARMRSALWAVLCVGCALGPDYRRPAVPMTAVYRGQTAKEAESFVDLPWWEVYRDPNLAALIRQAVTTGYDVRVAIARVEQARAGVGIATDALLPQISLTAQ